MRFKIIPSTFSAHESGTGKNSSTALIQTNLNETIYTRLSKRTRRTLRVHRLVYNDSCPTSLEGGRRARILGLREPWSNGYEIKEEQIKSCHLLSKLRMDAIVNHVEVHRGLGRRVASSHVNVWLYGTNPNDCKQYTRCAGAILHLMGELV